MITMKEVAEKAKVSRKTVYNVINKKGSYSKEVEEKVNNAIKELNYKGSLIAKSLRTGKTNLIGVVMPDIIHPSYSQFLVSFEKEARLNDYNIIICIYDYKKEQEAYYFEMLYKRGVDGIAYY
ncbi:MAG: LacI family DNA-binding transcriptional regulator, partial [Armatimonadetes bacterium]|nr:LacI family DNA-binding transcriptional regulator [Candidatus Hippobium faecium]